MGSYQSHLQSTFHLSNASQGHDPCQQPACQTCSSGLSSYLLTRLVILEKDLESAHVESAKKEAVIQHLLQSKVKETAIEETVNDQTEDIVHLQIEILQLREDRRHFEATLQKALDAIVALSTTAIACTKPKTDAVQCSRCCSPPQKENVEVENLIDLRGPVEENTDHQLSEEESTLFDGSKDDASDFGKSPKEPIVEQKLNESFTSNSSKSPYIIRFADSRNNATNSRKDVKEAITVLIPLNRTSFWLLNLH